MSTTVVHLACAALGRPPKFASWAMGRSSFPGGKPHHADYGGPVLVQMRATANRAAARRPSPQTLSWLAGSVLYGRGSASTTCLTHAGMRGFGGRSDNHVAAI